MRALVTGAAGFIGSHLCELMAERGDQVLGVDNFDSYYPFAAKSANIEAVQRHGVNVEALDVRRPGDLLELARSYRPDVIMHLAGKAGVRNSVERPAEYVEANVMGAVSVFETARILGDVHVVLASTSSVYAGLNEMPFDEEFAAITPLQPYAASKRSAELLASTYVHLYALTVTVTRFFTVYGERGRPDMMPIKLARSIDMGEEVTLFEGGLQRDWTHVSDIVEGLRLAALNPIGFGVLNLGRGQPVALEDFVSALEAVAQKSANVSKAPCPPSEMVATFANIERARKAIGFEPSVSVEDGVRRLWSWFQTDEAAPWRF